MMIVATMLKNKAPQAAWLVEVKDTDTDTYRRAACSTLGAAKRTAVEFARGMLDAPRHRLPWAQDEAQKADGIQYYRAEVKS